MIHLDATFVIDFIREVYRDRRGEASELLESFSREEVAVSVFVVCELFAGVHFSLRPEEERQRIFAFLADVQVVYPGDWDFAEIYALRRTLLQRSGQMIGIMDILIASLAVQAGAPLVTRNIKHYRRIPGLEILSY